MQSRLNITQHTLAGSVLITGMVIVCSSGYAALGLTQLCLHKEEFRQAVGAARVRRACGNG